MFRKHRGCLPRQLQVNWNIILEGHVKNNRKWHVEGPVHKKEIAATPAAKLAMDKERQRLRDKNVWDGQESREWVHVSRDARDIGEEAHFGYLFGICVEKNAGQTEGHPSRNFKGRVVFRATSSRTKTTIGPSFGIWGTLWPLSKPPERPTPTDACLTT